MGQQFVRVPPDSTGKRISHISEIDIFITDDIRANLKYGDTIVGANSGFVGTIAGFKLKGQNTEVSIVVDDYSNADAPTVGEFVSIRGTIVGSVASIGVAYLVQRNVIASGDNPYRMLKITEYGEILAKNTDTDAFGRVDSSIPNTIRNYQFNLPTDKIFCRLLQNGGQQISHSAYSATELATTSDVGSIACITSNLYHYYTPAISQLITMTIVLSDSGKAGNLRQWGYMDDSDGLFFELNGQTLNVVVRNSTSGTVQETRIPQSQWSSNRVNGEGGTFNINNAILDVTKDNIYWIDFQWLGAGRVRFGVYINGLKIVCHEVQNTNKSPRPYMRSGSLPIRYRCENTGVTSGVSSITAFCASVLAGGTIEPVFNSFGRLHVGQELVNSDTNRFVISSMRVKQTFDGRNNHSIALPKAFSVYTKDQPIVFEIVRNGTLTGTASETPWSRNPSDDSASEFDYAYNEISGGDVIVSRILAANTVSDIDLTEQFGLNRELLYRHANGIDFDTLSFCARTLYPSVSTDVWISLEWNELQIV